MMLVRLPASLQRQRAFSLIEVLIALTLATLLAATLFGALGYTSRIWDAAASLDARVMDDAAVNDWLRRELSRAVPVKSDEAEATIVFSGRRRELRFVAPLPAHLGGGGLFELTVGVEHEPDGAQLVLTMRPFVGDPPPDASARTRRVLAHDLEDARFAYYGQREHSEAAAWQDEWLDESTLPLLVRLSVTPTDPRRAWPRLVVRPVIDEARQ